MTKNDFKRLVPDVCCQDLIVETDNSAMLGKTAKTVADQMETGLVAYDYTAARGGFRLRVFTSVGMKAFLDALKPGMKITNCRGKEFAIESEPYITNSCFTTVRANNDAWFAYTLYDYTKNYQED